MVTMIMLAATIATYDPSVSHVRTSEPNIRALVEAGRLHSPTFRRLLETLNESDVIVYVRTKLTRPGLYAYLAHNMVTAGGHRYLRVALDPQGSWRRAVASLGHELQHAVEVAQAAHVRDAEGLEQMFEQANLEAVCGSGGGKCFETKAAMDVTTAILDELEAQPGL